MSTTNTDKATADLKAVRDKIAEWPEPYGTIGAQLHETILSVGPKLKPRLWDALPGRLADDRRRPCLGR